MGDNFLGKWFGGQRATDPAVEEARAELDHLADARPTLKPTLSWLRDLLPDLNPVPGSLPGLSLEPERASAKQKAGLPLLRGEALTVDPKTFRQRWQRACAALAAQQADGAAAELANAVRQGRLDPAEMVAAVVGGQPAVVLQRTEELGLEPGLAITLLRFALFPLLTALRESLQSWQPGGAWELGYCPFCGSWPLLGEFRGLEQTRFLRCGLCAAGWEVPRLWCPYCGSRDHEQLGFLHSEEEQTKYRASVCDGCRSYVKMVSTLAALPPLRLLVADAATLHLDLAATERGYLSPC